MKRIIIWFFIFLLFIAHLFPYKNTTLVLNMKGDGSKPVHTLNCHENFTTFIEVDRKETIKLAFITEDRGWELDRYGPFIWLRPHEKAKTPTTLVITTESGKLYQLRLDVVKNEEMIYLKTFITGGKNE